MISFDIEDRILKQTNIESKLDDSEGFSYVHQGLKIKDKLYLVGNCHIYSLDSKYWNKFDIVGTGTVESMSIKSGHHR